MTLLPRAECHLCVSGSLLLLPAALHQPLSRKPSLLLSTQEVTGLIQRTTQFLCYYSASSYTHDQCSPPSTHKLQYHVFMLCTGPPNPVPMTPTE